MGPTFKKAIVAASLGAFAVESVDVVFHFGKVHGLPSALQVAPTTSLSTASVSMDFVTHFGNAITEQTYENVADAQALKKYGVTVPTPPNVKPKAQADSAVLKSDSQVQLPLPPKPGPKA